MLSIFPSGSVPAELLPESGAAVPGPDGLGPRWLLLPPLPEDPGAAGDIDGRSAADLLCQGYPKPYDAPGPNSCPAPVLLPGASWRKEPEKRLPPRHGKPAAP